MAELSLEAQSCHSSSSEVPSMGAQLARDDLGCCQS